MPEIWVASLQLVLSAPKVVAVAVAGVVEVVVVVVVVVAVVVAVAGQMYRCFFASLMGVSRGSADGPVLKQSYSWIGGWHACVAVLEDCILA